MRRLLALSALMFAAAALYIGIAASGLIRFKGAEGFAKATTVVDYSENRSLWPGDTYAYGGIAKGSGGNITKTHYGEWSNPNSTEPVNTRLDQPEKGIGQHPGEFHGDHATGYGLTNGPVSQPSPSDANSIAAQAGSYAAPGGH